MQIVNRVSVNMHFFILAVLSLACTAVSVPFLSMESSDPVGLLLCIAALLLTMYLWGGFVDRTVRLVTQAASTTLHYVDMGVPTPAETEKLIVGIVKQNVAGLRPGAQ